MADLEVDMLDSTLQLERENKDKEMTWLMMSSQISRLIIALTYDLSINLNSYVC